MTNWTPEEASRALLAILPGLNRLLVAELRHEAGEETTMPQFRVLTYLAEGPLTLSAIARRRRVSLQAAGELIQILVERGWVIRTPDPEDRRQFLLSLTDEGRLRYQHADDRMLHHLIPLLTKLTAQEMAAVQVALPALHDVIAGEAIEEAINDNQPAK